MGSRIVFANGQLIDGSGGPPRHAVTLVVESDTISDVSEQPYDGSDCLLFDLEGKVIMPGLVDCHEHANQWVMWPVLQPSLSAGDMACLAVAYLGACLEVGITALCDMGGLEAGFVRGIDQGLIRGPRTQTSVQFAHPTAGLTDSWGGSPRWGRLWR